MTANRTRRTRLSAALAAGTLVLAACGGGSDSADGSSIDAPTVTVAPGASSGGTADQPTEAGGDTAPTDDAPADTGQIDTGQTDTGQVESTDDQPADTATDQPADTAGGDAADEMAWPDETCSADGSPSALDNADSPPAGADIRPISAAESPLPDLPVRRINCGGGWVNLINELPAEQPLLVWFWAPH